MIAAGSFAVIGGGLPVSCRSRGFSVRPVRRVCKQRRVLRATEEKKEEEAPVWTVPTLDPNTPSPVFGGSTGGLLNKAQVA